MLKSRIMYRNNKKKILSLLKVVLVNVYMRRCYLPCDQKVNLKPFLLVSFRSF